MEQKGHTNLAVRGRESEGVLEGILA